MNKNNRRLRLIVLVSVAMLAAVSWFVRSQGTKSANVENFPAVKVAVAQDSAERVPLEVAGFVRGGNRADLTPLASGMITRLFKQEGEAVVKGEVLATIDADQANAQVAAARSNIAALEETLKKAQKYYDQTVTEAEDSGASDETVKSAKRARDLQIQSVRDQIIAAQGSLGIAAAGQRNFTIRAPFSGKVLAVYGRAGGFASFGMPIISLASDNSFEIETYVSASNGRLIAVGDVATFTAVDGAPLVGNVSAVSVGADTESLKTLVRIRLDNAAGNVHLGDFLHGQLRLPRLQKSITLTSSAVVSRGGDAVVFTVGENGAVIEVPVKIGTIQDGRVEVTDGISAGERVVIEGQQNLVNGMIVKTYAAE